MGLFGRFFDYSKPGKGVDPDEPQKRPFFLYFELLWRKFSRFFTLNIIYSILLLPMALCVYWLFYGALYSSIAPELVSEDVLPSLMLSVAISFFELPVPVWMLLLLMSVVLFGPVTCGVTYITRCWVRQEHADLSDLYDRGKSNFRQGVLLGLLDILVYVLLLRNILSTDYGAVTGFTEAMLSVSRAFSVVGLIVYSFMRMYTYQMIVTFELKLSHALKNAWIFAIMGLWRNLLAGVVSLVTFALFFLLHPLVELAFFFLFSFSFWAYTNNFITFPLIKKHMIPEPDPEPESDAGGGDPPTGLPPSGFDPKYL